MRAAGSGPREAATSPTCTEPPSSMDSDTASSPPSDRGGMTKPPTASVEEPGATSARAPPAERAKETLGEAPCPSEAREAAGGPPSAEPPRTWSRARPPPSARSASHSTLDRATGTAMDEDSTSPWEEPSSLALWPTALTWRVVASTSKRTSEGAATGRDRS